MQPLGRSMRQIVLDGLPLVDGRALPDHEHLAAHRTEQHPQKADDPLRVEGILPRLQVEAAVQRDAADRREGVARELHTQHRGLAAWRPGAHGVRQQIEARLVSPDKGVPFLGCLFLLAGQRSSCQRRMASSSRWLARCMGRCRLQPAWRSSRLT